MTIEKLEDWLHRLVDAVVAHPNERELLHQELERVSNPLPSSPEVTRGIPSGTPTKEVG